jgi:enamine deaminase RidA (YjgF/YER057c/UK114 family)
MTGRIAKRLHDLGITLPTPPAPVASYVPTVITGNLIFVSGQVSFDEKGVILTGKAGADLDVDRAKMGARSCAINTLAQLQAALGDLDRVKRCVKLTGYVNATPDFREHPKVINGASDLFVEVFGEAGRHARSAVGAGSLPLNSAVEVESICEITP